jgi:hypothetical protein
LSHSIAARLCRVVRSGTATVRTIRIVVREWVPSCGRLRTDIDAVVQEDAVDLDDLFRVLARRNIVPARWRGPQLRAGGPPGLLPRNGRRNPSMFRNNEGLALLREPLRTMFRAYTRPTSGAWSQACRIARSQLSAARPLNEPHARSCCRAPVPRSKYTAMS